MKTMNHAAKAFLGAALLFGGHSTEGKGGELKQDNALLFYVPFDSSADAEAGGAVGKVEGEVKYVRGMKGDAVMLDKKRGARISYNLATGFDPDEGTLMFWIKPHWSGDDGLAHGGAVAGVLSNRVAV